MADSRRSRPADGASGGDVRDAVLELLAQALPDGGRVGVALSGGRDSIALLDAVSSATAAPLALSGGASGGVTQAPIGVIALHVHHGLSANADAWSAFCRDVCAATGVPFAMRKVELARRPRTSIEAQARTARYDALAALAHEHALDAVLLAHHADDQAETVLLQLLRGAGPRGLAAMAPISEDRGVRWLRPLLGVAREALDAYVTARGLRHIDDESNADARYRRNALRGNVVPALRAIAPGYPGTLVRAAALQADAAALLDELAELDARDAMQDGTLERNALRTLPPARGRNLLRWFVRQHRLRAPSSARLAEMLAQLAGARDDARVAMGHDGAQIGVHRGRIVVHPPAPAAFMHEWIGDPSVRLPHGTLLFTATDGTGIAQRRLAGTRVTIRAGTPGERLRIDERAPRRAVADLLREAGVPGWERPSLPRLYCGDVLAAVPRAGIDAAFVARAGEPAFTLDWHPG